MASSAVASSTRASPPASGVTRAATGGRMERTFTAQSNGASAAANQLTLCKAMVRIENTERDIDTLLYFRDNHARADSVYRASGHVNGITFANRMPRYQGGNRAILYRTAQLGMRKGLFQAQRYMGTGRCSHNVPGFVLAVRQPDGTGEGIIRMNLNRQRLACEQQFEKQARRRRIFVRALEPQLPYRAILMDITPRPKIRLSPRLMNGAHAGMFDRHSIL